MEKNNEIKIFEDKKVRTIWDAEQEKWFISIVDAIEALTGTDRPRKYWSDLKTKLKKEGSELSEKIGQLKIQSTDGKFYNTQRKNKMEKKTNNNLGVTLRVGLSVPSPRFGRASLAVGFPLLSLTQKKLRINNYEL